MSAKLNANALHRQRRKAIGKKLLPPDPYKALCRCGHRLSAHVGGWALTMSGRQCDKCRCERFQAPANGIVKQRA